MNAFKTTVSIQKTQFDEKALLELGMDKSIMSVVRIKADDELKGAIRDRIKKAIDGV